MRLLSFLVLATTALFADIIETFHFCEIEKYADPDTLLILDIDDTLLIPSQTLGSDVWFRHEFKKNQLANASGDPLDKTLSLWEAIRHVTQIQAVEKGADQLVAKMQDRGIPIMGLSTQDLALNARTVKQLQFLHLDLSRTAPSQEEYYFFNGNGVLYRKGILFTSGTHKGRSLLKFFEMANVHPKQVVFLNDKQTHLEEVGKSLEKAGISFTGLRYSYSDARVKGFRSEISDIQLRYSSFDRILSDDEAEAILKKK